MPVRVGQRRSEHSDPTDPIPKEPKFTRMDFVDLVAIAKGSEPDPIPNSTVKHFRADGTQSQDLGE